MKIARTCFWLVAAWGTVAMDVRAESLNLGCITMDVPAVQSDSAPVNAPTSAVSTGATQTAAAPPATQAPVPPATTPSQTQNQNGR